MEIIKMDGNIKPSVIKTFYQMSKELMSVGFTERDIVRLIQNRMSPKLNLTVITSVIRGIIKFENDFLEFQKIIGERNVKKLEIATKKIKTKEKKK